MNKLFIVPLVIALALSACGSDDDDGSASSTTTEAPTSTTLATTSTTQVAGLEQAAIWPAADVFFATPEAAAKDFVSKVLGVPPVLGEFRAGDAMSGEMQVFSKGEGSSATKVERGLLLLRKLGANQGWFITAAANDNASISSPEARATVKAGSLSVAGKARGFEANVVVRALIAGTTTELDREVTQGGSMETPEPFTVSLDLSGAKRGDTVMLLVRGGTGLETDPGEFGAIPVAVG